MACFRSENKVKFWAWLTIIKLAMKIFIKRFVFCLALSEKPIQGQAF